MFFSIIIPAYNEETSLKENIPLIITSLKYCQTKYKIEYEIIVVNNGSTDSTKKICELYNLRIIEENQRSISKALNTGAKYAFGNYYIFIHADHRVSLELFSSIYESANSNINLGGAVLYNYDKIQNPIVSWYLGVFRFFGTIFNVVQASCYFCQKEIYENINGFDENLLVAEDIDFYLRLKKIARKNRRKIYLVKQKYITLSARRINANNIFQNLFYLNPLSNYLFKNFDAFRRHWYIKVYR